MASSDLPHKPSPDRSHAGGEKKTPPKDGRSRQVQDKLDDALADSFPASDPVSIVTSHAEEDWGARDDETSSENSEREPGDAKRRKAPPPGGVPTGGH